MDAALKALAEPRRREILRLVWTCELPATDIADHFAEVTRPAVSQHLAVLKTAGLLTERRDGTRRLYRADRNEMKKLRKFLDEFWTSGLERLRDVAEASQRDKEKRLMAQLVREVMIEATPETIWPFLTEPGSLVAWHGTVAEIDPRPGGVYRVLVAGQFQSAGEYIEVVPIGEGGLHLRLGRKRPSDPAGIDHCRDHASCEGDKTRVCLVHSGLPDDAVEDHGHGWAFYLERLAVRVGGGDPGPDRRSSGDA